MFLLADLDFSQFSGRVSEMLGISFIYVCRIVAGVVMSHEVTCDNVNMKILSKLAIYGSKSYMSKSLNHIMSVVHGQLVPGQLGPG